MKRYQEILRSHEIRPSHHRIKVLEYLMTHKNHPTVDVIYNDLTESIPTISKATIYNTLKIFLEKGLATSLNVGGEEARYDFVTPPHAHFFCKICGALHDVDEKYACFRTKSVDDNMVSEVSLFFRGSCSGCLEKENVSD